MFSPSRLSFARRRRGLTKLKLAELLGITSKAISDYEVGNYPPLNETLTKLADVLDFPLEFFSGPDLEEPTTDTASFRAMKKMTAAQRDSALGAGALAFLLNDWIEAQFDLPVSDLPDLRNETPESAATAIRQYWGIGERPIKNLIHLLESKGVRVYSLAEDALEVDAFSIWHNGKPFVFLNTFKSSEHSRFDAAHELGHLVLHRHGAPHGQDAEKEANAFASAFLMPKSVILATCPRIPTLNQIIKLKHNWIVSVSALTYRLNTVGLLTEWHYRSLCIELSQKGYRKAEPEPAQREASQVLSKVLAALRDEGIGKQTIAKHLKISVEEVDKLVFGLAMVSIEGGRTGNAPTGENKANLKRLK